MITLRLFFNKEHLITLEKTSQYLLKKEKKTVFIMSLSTTQEMNKEHQH